MAETKTANASVPSLSGDREALTMFEREDSLFKALQWVRDELKTLKSQDQSLMRQFSSLRSKINMIKDDIPSSLDRNSTISVGSPRTPNDDDVFFAKNDSRVRFSSKSSARTKSHSSESNEEKLKIG